ncbi:MAG: hypothetical protein ABIA21_01750 [Candidatus Aenigmatarchaeota archaeon]
MTKKYATILIIVLLIAAMVSVSGCIGQDQTPVDTTPDTGTSGNNLPTGDYPDVVAQDELSIGELV